MELACPAGRPAAAGYALPGSKKRLMQVPRADQSPQRKRLPLLDAVRKRAANARSIRRMHFHHFPKLAHAAGSLGSQQMALAGMRAHNFARRSHFEPLGGSAMRLQFHFLVLLHDVLIPQSIFTAGGDARCACPARKFYAWPPAAGCAGRAGGAAVAPFFGASSARRIFASMRGPNSTSA